MEQLKRKINQEKGMGIKVLITREGRKSGKVEKESKIERAFFFPFVAWLKWRISKVICEGIKIW